MDITFNGLMDRVRELTLDEKEEMRFVIERTIIEERRGEIYKNYVAGRKECQNGGVKFSSNLDRLKKMVEE